MWKYTKYILYGFLKVICSLIYLLFGIDGINSLLIILPSKFYFHIPILKWYGAKIGEEVDINLPLIFHNTEKGYSNLEVGDFCHIGKDILLDLKEYILIKKRTTISMRTTIITHTDAGQSSLSKNKLLPTSGSVTIGEGCYIGAGTTILQGVTIGDNAIIGASSLVKKNVKPGDKIVGVPAVTIK